ncbi:MAG: DUF2126 domain-containing protein [Magnetovibrionaceae bacterium]
MGIHVALNHVTSYTYDKKIGLGPQVIRLRPGPHCGTPILSYALKVEPEGYFINWQQDPFGNYLARVVYPDPVDHFKVSVDLLADMSVRNPFDFFLEEESEEFPFDYEEALAEDLKPFLKPEPAGPLLQDLIDSVDLSKKHVVTFLVELNQRLQNDIEYLVRMEPGVQTPEETLERKKGSCRDSGWLLVQLLRHLGLAARFVSGYLIQLKPDVKSLDGPSGAEEDFTDLHAWCEVYLPGAGWIGLDPTSGLLAGEGHIPLACSPAPMSAAPITGMHEPADVSFGFDMSIERVAESPRITLPYTEEAWSEIEKLGHMVDEKLKDGDVRLTMGGEPTFISIDHPDGEEWNTGAVGPTKRGLAEELIRRLQAKYAPGGLLHYGQGKWYPGEQLPRWAFSLYWRRDGKPIWLNPDLIARETIDHAPGHEDARTLITEVAEKLGVGKDAPQEAFEDPWHFIDKERALPVDIEPGNNKLDDPLERARVARVFERGLETPTGFVLPVQRWQSKAGPTWVSETWNTRPGKLFLIPGDSPVGFRLPLASLKHIPAPLYPYIEPADPFEERDELPDPESFGQRFRRTGRGEHSTRQEVVEQGRIGGPSGVRAALTIEPRDGRLCVFMPPVSRVEDYLELLAAVEAAAEETGLPVHIEGYEPPKDPRLNMIKVTPDPGVIEVNIHPATSWEEMVENTETLYEEARLSRLGTEKFMLDGRHTGTGGGNHVVVGGMNAADSPFLRRPDLLKSLIAYWQHHPSLSYLFSGLFIGPTSQAPRIDEARNDSLYEMELAFQQVPDPSEGTIPLWQVDRIFRNLLIDVTGNTHRSEICIDKLYSPDGPTGRLGLVEFRAFEMPPHARMSLTQQLLLRSLIARFWDEPYHCEKLVRWGTELADRFMLPHVVWRDFCDVLADMNQAGFPLKPKWFLAHFEFRFPRYGSVGFGDIEIELRQALEPWHVMGEEGAVGGTVRFVDSSVERLQAKVSGMTGDRYQLGCNGLKVPLKGTGVNGEAIAGIRFKAWDPASALHPTIPTDAPLIFDLYDTWTGRAVAGCSYHVAHPAGRNYETFPVNSYEAESRRLARFFPDGHTPGPAEAPTPLETPEFPYTLDMRRRKRA